MVMLTLAIDQMKRTWTEKFLFYLSKEHSDELSHDLRMLQHEILYMGEAEWQQEVWLYENPGRRTLGIATERSGYPKLWCIG